MMRIMKGRADHYLPRCAYLLEVVAKRAGKGGWYISVQIPLPFPNLKNGSPRLRSVDAALRRSIPAFNQDVRSVQVRHARSAPGRLRGGMLELLTCLSQGYIQHVGMLLSCSASGWLPICDCLSLYQLL